MGFGIIDSISVGKNADGEKNVRLAKVIIEGEDIVTVELPFPEGDEFIPSKGDRVYFEEESPDFLIARCIQTTMDPNTALGEGERELFSRNGSSRAALITLKSDGTLVFNGGTESAVQYGPLNDALQIMVKAVNAWTAAVKTHTHPLNIPTLLADVYAGFSAIPNVSVDIGASEVQKVKL